MSIKCALRESLIIGLLAGGSAIFALSFPTKKNEVPTAGEVTLDDPRIRNGVFWIDARSRRDYNEGHVVDAIILNDAEWDSQLGVLFASWHPPQPIVVYCDVNCQASEIVARRLRDIGLEPVYVLKGGFEVWNRSHRTARPL